ncbi:MAG: helix-turn-helix domain-containing protein [Gemmatimonadota bacterium]
MRRGRGGLARVVGLSLAGNQGDWLTVDAAAAVLGVTPKTVYRMIGNGRLVAFKHRGAWRLPRGDVTDYFARLEAEARAAAEAARSGDT